MSLNKQRWADQNYSAPSTGANLGPYGITVTVAKLFEVSANVAFGQQGFASDPDGQIQDPFIWGVQWGPAGYTPLNLPGDIGSSSFFWCELPNSTSWGNVAWAPATDMGNQLGWVGGSNRWTGQLFIGNPIDFYISYAAIVSGFPEVYLSHSLSASYAY